MDSKKKELKVSNWWVERKLMVLDWYLIVLLIVTVIISVFYLI